MRIAGIAVLMLVVTAFAAAAASAGDDELAPSPRFQPISAEGANTGWLPASLSNKVVSAMVQMSGDPVAVATANAHKQGKDLSNADQASLRSSLKSKQDGIAKDLQQAGATIVGQTQDAYNGVLVHAPESALATIASLPGVTGVNRVGLHTVPDNVNGVPLIGAPTAWGSAGNLTGAGVKVAVIDTGVDYTHADFGGPGTAAAWNSAKASSTAPANPAWFGPAAPKVKGGWDFSGNDYDATVAGSTPQPDSNPLDCNGHGSHTSGTATGFGVLSSGATYSGTYNATTVSGNSWNVGPGVAPKADLYMYRIFGCAGSSDLAILAINKAVADHVDVISMSLGSPFGQSDQSNPEAVAVNNAVAAGVTVVASAGNNGTNGYLVGAPSTSNHALSVAAIDGSFQTYPAATMAISGGGSVTAINANGATFTDGLSAQVKVLRDASGNVSLGCNPAEYAAAAGKIAVVQRGTCARVARAVYGQKAGAVAVVMINTSGALPPFEGKITSNPDTGESYTVHIPFLGVKGCAEAVTCAVSADAAALEAADGKTVTLTNATTPNTSYKKNASFTSGGPRWGDSAAKPEIAAPGVSVTSALVGGGTAGTVLSGTSMACPMTSGTAALVKQAHPTWNGDQIKAALVNTADAGFVISYNGRIDGSGFLQAQKATDTDATASTADGLDSLSFGYVPGTGTYTDTRTFNVNNYGTSAITYNLAASVSGGATVAAVPSSFTVPAGGTQPVVVTLGISASTFAAQPSASTSAIGLGGVVTFRGAVTAVPTTSGAGIQSLRIPLLAVPRGLSDVNAGPLAPYTKQATNNVYTTSVNVANSGVHAGSADFYAWGIHDAKDLAAGAANDIRDVGVQTFDNGTGVFVVNTYNPVSTAATQEYDIGIDLQHNGKPDYFVVGADIGAVTTGTFDGRFGAFLFDAKTGARLPGIFGTESPMNSSTVEIPFSLAALGLHAGASDFGYSVGGFSVFGGAEDTTGEAFYDAAHSGVSTGEFASLPVGGSATIPLWADYDKLQSAPALGWLAVNVDDAGGAAQTDEIPLGILK